MSDVDPRHAYFAPAAAAAMPPVAQECGNDCLNFPKRTASFGSIFTRAIKKKCGGGRSSCKGQQEAIWFHHRYSFNEQLIKVQFVRNDNRCSGLATRSGETSALRELPRRLDIRPNMTNVSPLYGILKR